jgi:hypothetical protein
MCIDPLGNTAFTVRDVSRMRTDGRQQHRFLDGDVSPI